MLESHETESQADGDLPWHSRAAEEFDGSASSRLHAAGSDVLPSLRGAAARPSVRTASTVALISHPPPPAGSERDVSATRHKTDDRWSQLSRSELIALGRTLVTERLEHLGCDVTPPTSLTGGKLDVRTPSGRAIEVFVSTQRVGGYVFWTKRRLQPASNRFAAVALLTDADDPALYLVPSTEWRNASPPLKDRPNVGKKSEPEYGISLARTSLPALARYAWDERSAAGWFL